MPTLAKLPTTEPIAVADPVNHPLAAKLPRFLMSKGWIRYFSEQRGSIDQKPTRRVAVRATGQTASIATTPLPLGSIPPGVWRISYRFRITTPATTSSSLTFTLAWEEGGVTQSESGAAETGNTTTSGQFGTLIIRVDTATPISYATTYASVGATPMAYDLDVVAEELALD
jgi:hypothetical protein